MNQHVSARYRITDLLTRLSETAETDRDADDDRRAAQQVSETRRDVLQAASAGWPAVLANLKSVLETGHVLPRAPWEMHAELRAESMARNSPG